MNHSVKKINTAGSIGSVISVILIIGAIASLVCTTIGTIAVAVLPKESISVAVSTNIDVEANGDFFGWLKNVLSEDDALVGEGEGATAFTVNDVDFPNVTINETENGISFSAVSDKLEFQMGRLLASLVCTIIYLASIVIMLYMIKALMKELKNCDTPFREGVIRRMKRFGYSLIPVIVLSMITEAVWNSFLTRGSALDISLDISGILVLAVVFVLIIVFSYGAELQKESDEML